MFVYLIINQINGKYYVGQTIVSVEERWNNHVAAAKSSKSKSSNYFVRAIQKYGKESFKVHTLCECPDLESLDKSEIFFIWFLASHKPSFGYNMTLGGRNGSFPTKESIAKISQALKGHVLSEETKRKISVSRTGKKHSEETKHKISEFLKTRPPTKMSEEGKARVRESKKNFIFTEEHRRKIRESKLGKPRPELLGRSPSEETRCKLSLATKGIPKGPFSEEHKQAMRDGWARRKQRLLEENKNWEAD